MLNNIGLPGLLFLLLLLSVSGMGIYFLARIPNRDERFHYAGFWMRVLAHLIDGVIRFVIGFIPFFLVGFAIAYGWMDTMPERELEVAINGIGMILWLIYSWLYFAFFESSRHQATPGKMLLGLKVVDLEGERIGFAMATGRYFGCALSAVTFYIGYFMAGWTKQKQALHDMMAGCLVVRAKPRLEHGDRRGAGFRRDAGPAPDFDAEALRRYRAGELSGDAFMEIAGRRGPHPQA